MSDIRLHMHFMKSTLLLTEQSKCVSYKVAAQIVKDKRIISMGYNGTPAGTQNCDDVFDPKNFNREDHHKWSASHEIHAEMNAIMFTAKENISIKDSTMYVSHHPCDECLKNMIQSGIKQVYYYADYDKRNKKNDLLKYINVTQFEPDLSDFIAKNNLSIKTYHKPVGVLKHEQPVKQTAQINNTDKIFFLNINDTQKQNGLSKEYYIICVNNSMQSGYLYHAEDVYKAYSFIDSYLTGPYTKINKDTAYILLAQKDPNEIFSGLCDMYNKSHKKITRIDIKWALNASAHYTGTMKLSRPAEIDDLKST